MATTAPASFYVTGGTLRQDAPSYVERQADRDLYEGLLRGEFCYVLTSRQMGKSSLMVHTAGRLRQEGVAVVVLDLTAVGQNLSAEQWYGGLIRRVGRQLDPSGDLEEALDDLWFEQEARVGPLERWMAALERVVLPRCRGRIVLFIDEIDAVRSLPFSTDEFFAAIRECYNRRTQDPAFERLTFCLLGVAAPSDLIQDTRTTPFNIGRRIELTDFTPAEAAPLAAGLSPTPPPAPPLQGEGGLSPGPLLDGRGRSMAPPSLAGKGAGGLGRVPALLPRILYWTGGHPYLTQRLCQAVAADGGLTHAAEVDHLCDELFLAPGARETDDNLLFVRERLLKSEGDPASLLDLYGKVRAGKPVPVDDANPLVDLLRLSGVTRAAGGRLLVRNRIYERVFDQHWVLTHMPDAELRRQRAAYRQGLLRATAVAMAVLAVVIGLALAAFLQARRADRNARREALQRQRAESLLYAADVSLAQQAWEGGDLAQARKLLEAQKPRPGQEDRRGFEWRYLWRLCHQETPLCTFPGDGQSVAFSPDSKMIASGVHGGVTLWDVRQGRAVATLKGEWVGGYSFSPNGRLLAVGDGPVKLWDVATRRVVKELKGNPQDAGTVAFSPDGRTIAGAANSHIVENLSGPGEVVVWDVASGRSLATLRVPGHRMWQEAFSPDGKMLATTCDDGAAKLWSTASWKKVGEIQGALGVVAFSPNGRMLASAGSDWTARLWDVATRREIATLQGHQQDVSWVAFSPDGKTLSTCGVDKMVKLWDVSTMREVRTLEGHAQWVNMVAFSPDGRLLASAADDGTTKLWDVTRKADRDVLPRQPVGINALSFSADSRKLFVLSGPSFLASRFGGVTVWDSATGRERAAFGGLEAGIEATAISPDGQTLALAREGGDRRADEGASFELWDVASRHQIAELKGRAQRFAAAFSPDGKILAAGGWDWKSKQYTLTLWDIPSRRQITVLPGHSPIRVVAFSPDGRRLAWNEEDQTISLWDVAARRRLATFQQGDRVNGVAFSPDGAMLAAGGDDHTVKLWSCLTRHEIATLKGHSSLVMAVAFSPDGKTLASTGWDGTVKLWNLATMQVAATLAGHREKVRRMAFSPDGAFLATGDYTGTVRLWRAARFAEADARSISRQTAR